MRCVCARIRTSFSCISICNLSPRLEKGACSQAPFLLARAKPDSAKPTSRPSSMVLLKLETQPRL
jgi:hypothetical protein